MKKTILRITLISFLFSLYGCETLDQHGKPDPGRTAMSGAAIGGTLGAFVGVTRSKDKSKVKNALLGSVVGALAGGLVGYIYGKEREREYKSAEQIYIEKPALTRRSNAHLPPYISDMRPVILNEQERPIKVIKGGQKIWLGMKYQIDIPFHSNIKEVDVVEINTLTLPNGATTDEKSMTRTKRRRCGGIDAAIQFTIPDDAPEGIYIHRAVVIFAGKKYQRKSKINLVKVDGQVHYYVLN